MITQTPQPVVVRPQRRVGEFKASCTISENATDELEITKHPVQDGATISDHAYLKPSSLALKVIFTDEDRPLQETYRLLLELQASKQPFDVVTSKRLYKNMLMKTLAQTTDEETENLLSINFSVEQIIIVQVETTSVPPRAKQAAPGRTGSTQSAGSKSAQAVQKKPKRQQSILASARG